ncbi:MAG: hypothetical protein HY868_04880 [Chloroflexi bacterium]|nr:hypothetical protein [Chloroflexota bacterium]
MIPKFVWHEVEPQDWARAAQLWSQRELDGRPIADADVLIAAQVKRLGAILVTDNEKDFDDLGLQVENWKSG